MVAPDAAWLHTLQSAGDDQNRNPSSLGVTPTNVISTGTAYTGGELTTVSTDDSSFVGNFVNTIIGTTNRSNHMFRFDGIAADPPAISDLKRFGHLVNGSDIQFENRLYIWNDNLSQWDQLASSDATGLPRTMSGPASAPLADYVNGSGEVFVLLWAFEGTHQPGAPGCVHEDTLIALLGGGSVKAVDVQFGGLVFGYQDGQRVARKVDEITIHYNELRNMVQVACGALGFLVNAAHLCAVVGNEEGVRASALKLGDLIPDAHGNSFPVTDLVASEIECTVVDLDVRNDNYEVNGGLLVRTMGHL